MEHKMARWYEVRARTEAGDLFVGRRLGYSKDDVVRQLFRERKIPVSVQVSPTHSLWKKLKGWRPQRRRLIPMMELQAFCRQWWVLYRAGIPMIEALSSLQVQSHHPEVKTLLSRLLAALKEGHSLSEALVGEEGIPPLFLALVRAGEGSGRLDETLGQLSDHLALVDRTEKEFKQAMRYPILVTGSVFCAVLMVQVVLIPKITLLFSKFSIPLPWPTRVLMAVGRWTQAYGFFALLALGLGGLGLGSYLKTSRGRWRASRLKLKIPIVGRLYQWMSLSSFARTLATTLRSGVPLDEAVLLSAPSLNSTFLESHIPACVQKLRAGIPLSEALEGQEGFTPLLRQMVGMGEKSGHLDELLDHLRQFYEEELSYELKRLPARLEPIILVVLAGMVLILSLGVMLPLWDLVRAVKR